MNNSQTLVQHRDIQNWVAARHGMPAIARVPDKTGEVHAQLALSFGSPQERPDSPRPDATPPADTGMSPVSWNAWLAELDRQHLALKVSGQHDPDFEFVERQDAAQRNLGEQLN